MKTDDKIKTYAEIADVVIKLRAQDKTIAFTSGCYDLLHLGHIVHLTEAAEQADILIVNLGNDKTVQVLKGHGRPIFNEQARARMLAALEVVHCAVISEEFGKMDHAQLLEIIRPDIFVVNSDDSHLSEKRELIKKMGGKLYACHRVPPPEAAGVSTTELIRRLRAS